MRLYSFQIENYRSIEDTGIVELSEYDNISIFAGQNESGKSAILRALKDFKRGLFEEDSIPFLKKEKQDQIVSCTYKIDNNDSFFEVLSNRIIDHYKIKVDKEQKILNPDRINRIDRFTITRTNSKTGTNGKWVIQTKIDQNSFNIFKSAILDKPAKKLESEEIKEEKIKITEDKTEKYINVTDEQNSDIADIFLKITPEIVFFDDFCDLLPDRIYYTDLEKENINADGYRAVKNFEKILRTDFTLMETEDDLVREARKEAENDRISINFRDDWGQRIYNTNNVDIKYKYEKRSEGGEIKSYMLFYVETKKGEKLSPKQRSKGLIWFLSLWLELKAQENDNLVLLLDEPDQHLHVNAQKDILKVIENLADKGNQIIVATHSPYLIEADHLSRIKLIINTEDFGTIIEDITTSEIDTENKKDALQPIANAIGLHVSEFSGLKNKNIILEGISDYYYFSAMQEILNRKGDYYFVPGIGVRQIKNLISFCIGYGLRWISIIDDDPEEGGIDSKTKFDEIKDFIFDGKVSEAKKKVYILKNIVGIENMFTHDDLKLINSTIKKHNDNTVSVGKKRKELFSRLFFDKVKSKNITEGQISKTAKDNFKKAFDFIDKNFVNLNSSENL